MIFQMIQEGGPGAYLAIALGFLGVALGGVALLALLGKNRSAFALGVVTLLSASGAAGAGMAGTAWGRTQVSRALSMVDSELDKERIMRAGFREAQSASWIGLFAALVPLVLGAAAAVGGSRIAPQKTRAQAFGDPMVAADEGLSGQTVLAFIFTAIAVLACGGAWTMAHSELPKLRYGFDEHDMDSWALAGALEDLNKGSARGCGELERALEPFWGATDKREWPRVMRRPVPPELAAWRQAADGCATKLLDSLDEGELTREELLESPLLQNDALHAAALAWKKPEPVPEPKDEKEAEEPEEDPDAPPARPGVLKVLGSTSTPKPEFDRAVIPQVIRRHMAAIKYCYERELVKSPNLEGKIVVSFTIGAEGKVVMASDASPSPFSSPKVSECVVSRFKRMEFPRPGTMITVKYPIIFKSAE